MDPFAIPLGFCFILQDKKSFLLFTYNYIFKETYQNEQLSLLLMLLELYLYYFLFLFCLLSSYVILLFSIQCVFYLLLLLLLLFFTHIFLLYFFMFFSFCFFGFYSIKLCFNKDIEPLQLIFAFQCSCYLAFFLVAFFIF